MARKSFAIRTEPHVAEIGDVELLLVPEVYGSAFLDAYEKLREMQKRLGDDLSNAEPGSLRAVTTSIREFLSSLMLPESAETFLSMRLPDRVLIELMEWALALYANGEEDGGRPTGPSSGSAAPSRRAGKSSTRTSSSRASTSTP